MAHLVWDWNGTLLDDLTLVVAATNASLATVGGPPSRPRSIASDFRRPISDVLRARVGRTLVMGEFAALDRAFHDAYRRGLPHTGLVGDAMDAIAAWPGTQSLLSMFFHDELVPAVAVRGLNTHLSRVDGLRDALGGGSKAPHLRAHLNTLGLRGAECVLIGDSVDDADAADAVGAEVVLYAGGFTHESTLRATGRPVATTLVEAVNLAVDVTRDALTTDSV